MEARRQRAAERGGREGRDGGRRRPLTGALLALVAMLLVTQAGCGLGGPGVADLAAAPSAPPATATPTLPARPQPAGRRA